MTDGPAWSYELCEGRWLPDPETRELPAWLAGETLSAAPAAPCESP